METPVCNADWPDLFERFERVVLLCAGLILEPLVPALGPLDGALMAALWILAIGSHFTAGQRLVRAASIVRAADRRASAEGAAGEHPQGRHQDEDVVDVEQAAGGG
jgi:hypothetical protein